MNFLLRSKQTFSALNCLPLQRSASITQTSTSRLLHSIATTTTRTARCNTHGTGGWRNIRNREFCTNVKDSTGGTRTAKDIILFRYENPKYYNMMNFFGISQLCFWTYLSHFAFTQLRDAPIEQKSDDELKWYERINLGDNKYRNGITVSCFLVGYGILCTVWMFTLRSVRFLILRPGGKEVSLVTYGPFNKNRILTVPLKCISAQESRQTARVQLPLKVKNRALYYVLDMRGEFRNPELFDQTAGLKRRL